MALLIFNDDTTDNDGLRVENQWYTECMQCGLCLARLQFYCRVTRYCLCVAARRQTIWREGWAASVPQYSTILLHIVPFYHSVYCHYYAITSQHSMTGPHTLLTVFSPCVGDKKSLKRIQSQHHVCISILTLLCVLPIFQQVTAQHGRTTYTFYRQFSLQKLTLCLPIFLLYILFIALLCI